MHSIASRPPVASQAVSRPGQALAALRAHWPEYLIEGAALGTFMVSACSFGVLLGHPGSPLSQVLAALDPLQRRLLGGVAMGLTAVSIFCSPWGKRSGAHMNPAVTLTFLTLGKVAAWDAWFYVLFQFLGGVAGVLLSSVWFGEALGHASVNYVVTAPGPLGPGAAFAAEALISAVMMSTVLYVSNSSRLTRYTPWLAGTLIAAFITFESPLSGMSMNPARTFASGLSAHRFPAIWVYFSAPLAGMLLAAFIYRRIAKGSVYCAKFHHGNSPRCIFRCRFGDLHAE